MARRSVAITTGTSVDCRRLAPNSQKDCLLSYIASILQGPSGSAGACWASTPHAKAAYIPLRGGGFYRYMGHYVFMHFAPSFLPSRAGAVTRIYRSKRDRYQWIELNEYIKVTGCPREVTNTVNVGDGVKTLFICNWQVLKQLLLSG